MTLKGNSMTTAESQSSVSPTLVCSGRRAATVIFVTVVIHTILFFLPAPALPIAAAIAGSLFALALLLRDPLAVHVTFLTFAIAICVVILPWPFFFVIPLAIYAAVVAATPSLRQTMFWWRLGKFDKPVWGLVILTVVASSAALLLWFFLLRPDLSNVLALIPSWSPVLLILSGLGFSLGNAAIEEFIYRGVMMQGLDAAVGANYLSVILQAILFGFIHIVGVPGGWIGVSLATIYGLMLGLIRRVADGMLAPFVAHVFADLVIFSIVTVWVKGT
ncbi:MAG TPA: hypothetical protein DEV81_18885 [Cyanobacteria bacterium UBA11049]|nr:hypothetical protein [Cyanobacteria bacterium UBA11049]